MYQRAKRRASRAVHLEHQAGRRAHDRLRTHLRSSRFVGCENNKSPLETFDENAFMNFVDFDRYPLEELLAEFAHVRGSHLYFFKHLPLDAWLRRGIVIDHPATVRAFAYVMAGHAKHHLDILRRGSPGKNALLIFDFDGLIIDSESLRYNSWKEVFSQHGCELAIGHWSQYVGLADKNFDPYSLLAEMSAQPIDRK